MPTKAPPKKSTPAKKSRQQAQTDSEPGYGAAALNPSGVEPATIFPVDENADEDESVAAPTGQANGDQSNGHHVAGHDADTFALFAGRAEAEPPELEGDTLRLVYIPVPQVKLWDRNAKLHDLGALAQSISEHGYRVPSVWDSNLNDGQGGIIDGNGRAEVLEQMQAQGQPRPRNIAQVVSTGEWAMPIIVGGDAESAAKAMGAAIDFNNLTLSGGDFSPLDMQRLWTPDEYLKILTDIASEGVHPVTVDGDDLDFLLAQAALASGGGKELNGDPDEIPTEIQTRVKPGDLYGLGRQVVCPKCGKRNDVKLVQDGGSA